jgi:hypothetical protein
MSTTAARPATTGIKAAASGISTALRRSQKLHAPSISTTAERGVGSQRQSEVQLGVVTIFRSYSGGSVLRGGGGTFAS